MQRDGWAAHIKATSMADDALGTLLAHRWGLCGAAALGDCELELDFGACFLIPVDLYCFSQGRVCRHVSGAWPLLAVTAVSAVPPQHLCGRLQVLTTNSMLREAEQLHSIQSLAFCS
jgi:hypothetical protein